MRKAFIESFTHIIQKDPLVILLTGDLGFTVFEELRSRYPEQFLNTGVAEQNMIGIAAGLALSGKIPVCYSIASFITTKTYEQIKIDIASHNLPCVIVGTGAGLSYSTASVTHHSLDDVALMRLIPNMTIYSPADNQEVSLCILDAVKRKSLSYIRLAKQEEKDIHKPKKLESGYVLEKGHGVLVLATGTGVNIALQTASIMNKQNVHPSVVSMPVLKPVDEKLLYLLMKNYSHIATIEEHGIIGGLGSIVSEYVTKIGLKTNVLRFGTPDAFIFKIGSLETLRTHAGLDPQSIADKIIHSLKT